MRSLNSEVKCQKRTQHPQVLIVIAALSIGMFKVFTVETEAVSSKSETVAKDASAADQDVFYVYHDKGSRLNHFIPAGWIGDCGDLRLDDGERVDPKGGNTCIKISYSAAASQGAKWAGICWQRYGNYWGSHPKGYDLTGYKKLTFWAKGVRNDGKPIAINEFKMGGHAGFDVSSDTATMGPIDLTGQWKQYALDLANKDLADIYNGFCWTASRGKNPDGFELYLDEIRYEKQ